MSPTSPDDPELEENLGPHDPRRRAMRGGKLRGDELKAAIRKMAAEGKETHEIVEKLTVSRAYVHRVLTEETDSDDRVSVDDLAPQMVKHLRAGVSPAQLLDLIPEIAGLFRRRAGGSESSEQERERVLKSLRQLISSGANAEPGSAARMLHDARAAGRLVDRSAKPARPTPPADRPPPSGPAKPKPRGK